MIGNSNTNTSQEHSLIKQLKLNKIPILANIPFTEFRTLDFVTDVDLEVKREIEKISMMINHLSYGKSSVKSILISSIDPGEGKTTIAVNLAKILAKKGKKVLLVDCDIFKPTINKYFEVENKKGLVDIIEFGTEIDSVIRKTDIESLRLITPGSNSLYPEGLFTSSSTPRIIKELENKADIVLFDMLSFNSCDGTKEFAKKFDKVVMIYDPLKNEPSVLIDKYNELKKLSVRFSNRYEGEISLLGVVINKFKESIESSTTIMLSPSFLKRKSFRKFIKYGSIGFIALFFLLGAIYYIPKVIDFNKISSKLFPAEKKTEEVKSAQDTTKTELTQKPQKNHNDSLQITPQKEKTEEVLKVSDPDSRDSADVKPETKDKIIQKTQKEEAEKEEIIKKPTPEPKKKSTAEAKQIYENDNPYKYSVHVSSFQEIEGAKKEVNRFENKNMESFFTTVHLGDKGTWYRVFVGAFHSEEIADKKADELAKYTNDLYAAAVNVKYSLCAGTFSSKEKAQKKLSQIPEKYSPYILTIKTRTDESKYNVYIGAFRNQEEAEKTKDFLKQDNIETKFILR